MDLRRAPHLWVVITFPWLPRAEAQRMSPHASRAKRSVRVARGALQPAGRETPVAFQAPRFALIRYR